MASERFDVVIVGAGPAGIFAAIELVRLGRHDILLIDKGYEIERRRCPARQTRCIGCPECHITSGWGGAGAFSDGKLTLTTEVGGWLSEYVDRDTFAQLIGYADAIWVDFGAGDALYRVDPEAARKLTERAESAGMKLVPMDIRHMGSDRSPAILQRMHLHLAEAGVRIRLRTEVVRILVEDGEAVGVELAGGERIEAGAVVVAPGRDGADWLAEQASALGLGLVNNAVDIGVRVEVPAPVMEPLTKSLYEAKLVYCSNSFGDEVRTFCMNPYGEVTVESYGEVITVNGHSYATTRTSNTNFAVLVSQRFTQPFHEPIKYGRSIARLANLLGDGIIVQRLGDLEAGHRSTPERIAESQIEPTMPEATPGDLSFVLPYRHLADILEFLHALEDLAPGVASGQTLLYGVEVKFYSSRLELDGRLMTRVGGLYAVGDGAGVTRGLIQSSVSGVLAARSLATA